MCPVDSGSDVESASNFALGETVGVLRERVDEVECIGVRLGGHDIKVDQESGCEGCDESSGGSKPGFVGLVDWPRKRTERGEGSEGRDERR